MHGGVRGFARVCMVPPHFVYFGPGIPRVPSLPLNDPGMRQYIILYCL